MVTPKLSPIETQRVVNAAVNSVPMERSSMPINDHIEYKAFAGRQVLFVALIDDAFEALWRSAVDLYNSTIKRLKAEKTKEKKASRRKTQ